MHQLTMLLLLCGLLAGSLTIDFSPPSKTCCSRHERIEQLPDEFVERAIDVGHCSHNCHRRDLFDKLADPLTTPEVCTPDTQCRPARSSLRRVATAEGDVREVPVIEECSCEPRTPYCLRQPLSVRIFPDTPHETTLDIGTCSGHCSYGGCRVVAKRSVSVNGPNGAQSYDVVQLCSCEAPCYRMRRLETVHEYATNASNINDNFDPIDGTDLRDEPVIKDVDVGECAGSCGSADDEATQCAEPFWRNSRSCSTWLYSSRARSSCRATAFRTRSYTSRSGQRRHLISIAKCACK